MKLLVKKNELLTIHRYVPSVSTGEVFSFIRWIVYLTSYPEERINFLSQMKIGFSYQLLTSETFPRLWLIHEQSYITLAVSYEKAHVAIVDQILYRVYFGRSEILQ